MAYYFCFFFFFQAEDGIRDLIVTGVQTCALPISRAASIFAAFAIPAAFASDAPPNLWMWGGERGARAISLSRSRPRGGRRRTSGRWCHGPPRRVPWRRPRLARRRRPPPRRWSALSRRAWHRTRPPAAPLPPPRQIP